MKKDIWPADIYICPPKLPHHSLRIKNNNRVQSDFLEDTCFYYRKCLSFFFLNLIINKLNSYEKPFVIYYTNTSTKFLQFTYIVISLAIFKEILIRSLQSWLIF